MNSDRHDNAIIVCGSNSKNSTSKSISEFLSRSLNIWALYFNPSENIPIINNEIIETGEVPNSISFLLEKIKEYKILLFVYPQYNYNLSGFFKNVIDWCSLNNRALFYGKRVILIGVSSTEMGSREFEQTSSLTFDSLGAEEIFFFNTTKNTSMRELANKLQVYV